MRTNLDGDPNVFRIAEALDLPDLHVIGLLWKIWSWADSHSQNGDALGVTVSRLDRITGVPGFAEALRKVGWLDGRGDSLSFPRFAEHNGKTAKSRAQTATRMKRKRDGDSVTEPSPEKRREEKRRDPHPPPSQAKGFGDEWNQWCLFRESVDGRPIDPIRAEAILMELGRRSPEKARRDIQFSILKGAKSILDSDNDFDKQKKKRGGGSGGSKRQGGIDI